MVKPNFPVGPGAPKIGDPDPDQKLFLLCHNPEDDLAPKDGVKVKCRFCSTELVCTKTTVSKLDDLNVEEDRRVFMCFTCAKKGPVALIEELE